MRWLSAILFKRLLVVGLVLLLGVGSAAGWLLASESGGVFLAARLSAWSGGRLSLYGFQGRLLDEWRVARLRLALPGLLVEAQGVSVSWHPLALRQHAVEIDRLSLRELEIRSAPSSAPLQQPTELGLPLSALRVGQLQVDQLRYGALITGAKQPAPDWTVRQLRAQIQSEDGVHQVSGLALDGPFGHLGGALTLGARAPFPLALKLKLVGAVDDYRANVEVLGKGSLGEVQLRLDARSAMSKMPGLQGSADLLLQPFASLPLRQAQVNIRGLDPAAFHAQAPHALLDIQADLVPSLGDASKDGLKGWRLRGPLKISNKRTGTLEEQGLPLQSLSTQLEWLDGHLHLDALALALPGKGRVAGELGWTPLPENPLGQIEAELTFQDIDPAQISQRARAMRLGGKLTARGDKAGQVFAVELSGEKLQLSVRGEQREGLVRIERADLRAFAARATLSGSLALGGSHAYTLQGELAQFDPQVFLREVPAGALSASFSATGALKPMPSADLKLSISPSRFAGYLVEGTGRGRVTPGRLQDAEVNFIVLGNQLRLNGAIGAVTDELHLALDAPHLERLGADYSGSLKADGRLSGGIDQPQGELNVQGRQLRAPGGWRLAHADLSARMQAGDNGAVALKAELRELAQLGPSGLQTWLHDLNLAVSGSRIQHQLILNAGLPGETSVQASAVGGLRGQRWRGHLLGLGCEGPVRLVLEKPAALEVSAERVSLAEARLLSQAAEHGRIELLQTEWTPERLLAKGRISGVQLGFSLDEYQRTVFRGRSLQLGANWDLALGDEPRGLVRIFREDGDFVLQGDAPVALGLENFDINAAIEGRRLALSALVNGSRIGAFNAVATVALKGRGGNTRVDMAAPLVGVLNADIPSIAWLGPLADQNLRTAGSLRGQFNFTGTPEKPVGAGFIQGDALGLALGEQGLRLDRGRLVLNFDANRVRLEALSFHSDNRMAVPDGRLPRQPADGALSGAGEIALPAGKGEFQFRLDHVAALQQPGQWLMLSGDARVTSGWDQLDINAHLKSDAGFIGVARSGAPRLSDDVVIRGRQKPPQRLRLNAEIAFDFGEDFILKAYGIDTWLNGKLQIKLAQGSLPRGSGSIRARDGIFNAYGQKLEIDRGAVNFHGPLDDPALNIVALRKGLEVEAGVEVTGSAQRPKVRLVSEPSVPEQEKLAWILFGRPSEGSAADIGVLLSAAGANLGKDGEGLSARIASGFGLDSVGVASSSNGPRRGLQSSVANNATAGNPSTANASGNGSDTMGNQVLSVGKRLSSRAYLSFEQNFLGTESVVKLSYALSRAFSLVARGGTENALDLNYSLSFR